MLSESIWKRQKSILQQDASNISILKKEINKQTEIDSTVQITISDKIQNLQKNAAFLAKKLQNEKHRNHELQTIIKFTKDRMESEKLQEANFRENNNSQSLASLENKLKKLQYDLGQVNSKTNKIVQAVDDKKSKISQDRTERVIDSGIFRNIEKELTSSGLKFKKLLIEKVRHQKEYQKFVKQYNQLKQKAEKATLQASKNISKIKTTNQSTVTLKQVTSKIISKNKFKRIQSRRQTKGRSLTIQCEDQIDYDQEKEVVAIKKMLSRTGVEECGDLIFFFQHVDEFNANYFNEINNYIDQSNEIEKYLAEAKIRKNNQKMRSYLIKQKLSKQKNAAKVCQQLNAQLDKQNIQIQKQHQQFLAFFESQQFKQWAKQIDIQLPPKEEDQSLNFQNLIHTLRLLQKNTHQLICYENQSRLKISQVKTNSNQNLNQIISQVKKSEELLKVMKKQDFQEQYYKIVKNFSQKTISLSNQKINKKKSCVLIKK